MISRLWARPCALVRVARPGSIRMSSTGAAATPSRPAGGAGEDALTAPAAAVAAHTVVDWEQFRVLGKEAIDFVADYYKTLGDPSSTLPVRSQVSPGYLRELLPKQAPESPEALSSVLEDVMAHIMPGVTHWQHPSFFGFFPANSSPPAVIGDLLSGMFNVIGFSWVASPALTELESIVLDWFAQLLGVPLEAFGSTGRGGGVIQGTASEATLVALLAAKARAIHCERERHAAAGGTEAFDELGVVNRLVLYSSDQAHSSVSKAAMIAGIPKSQCRILPTRAENNYALVPEDLERAMREDINEQGLIPCFTVLTMGTTSSGAFDPLKPCIAAVRRATAVDTTDNTPHHQCWLHVDAAWAGSALICEEYRPLLGADGLADCDSFDVNPHKWLKTNFDCSTMYVRERKWFVEALSITPEYLRSKAYEEGLVSDYRDYQIPLGRRFRALKLWLLLRMEGSNALKAYIREHVRLAQEVFAKELLLPRLSAGGEALFEIVTPPSLSLVCFRMKAAAGLVATAEEADKLQEALLNRLNASGKLFLVHTKLAGKEIVLRMAIGGALTTEEHVRKAVTDITDAAREVIKEATTAKNIDEAKASS